MTADAEGVPSPMARRPELVMDVDDAARAVRHMASLPPGSNVLFLTVMAAGMPLRRAADSRYFTA